MKVAVTYENGQVFQHFGHTSCFKVYEIENGQVVKSGLAVTGGQGHGALAGVLRRLGADALICGGIGGGARTALSDAGIELYPGVKGDADEAVAAFIAGTLAFDPNTVCNHHHDHEHGHDCGSHSCGDHHQEGHECRHGKCN